MPAASEPVEQQQPVPAPAPAPAPAASDDPEWDFFTFMQQAGPKFGEGDNQLSQAYLQQVCQQFGIGSITDLAANNDSEQIGKVVAQFRADGRW